jgi:AraC-like DNA-binding protein
MIFAIAMDYRTYPAPPELSHLVRFFWSLESAEHGAHPHRLIAETCPNIVFVLQGGFVEADGSECPKAHLAGAMGGHMNMVGQGPFSLFGVYLWPWAVRVFFGLEPAQCKDRLISLTDVCGTKAGTLELELQRATDTDMRIDRITHFLSERGAAPKAVAVLEPLVTALHGTHAEASVEELITRSGLSRRSFERRFKDCTGFSPATYLRILRFQGTYRMLENGKAHSLTDIAYASGFFDQSHFIRDFKRFSGLNPRSYFVKTGGQFPAVAAGLTRSSYFRWGMVLLVCSVRQLYAGTTDGQPATSSTPNCTNHDDKHPHASRPPPRYALLPRE